MKRKILLLVFIVVALAVAGYFGRVAYLEKRYIDQMNSYSRAEEAKKNPPYTLHRSPGNHRNKNK